jgi:crotonobetainyl-CoA:carnitine CoA-transferase CaiB-like acyl-CoA transferase
MIKHMLVSCSISAFGQDGPRGSEGGFDLSIQASAGGMGVAGEPDGAPINGYAEALADPQAAHLQLVQAMVLPNGAATRTVACPVRIDGQVLALGMRPPALGEHTAAVATGLLAK